MVGEKYKEKEKQQEEACKAKETDGSYDMLKASMKGRHSDDWFLHSSYCLSLAPEQELVLLL